MTWCYSPNYSRPQSFLHSKIHIWFWNKCEYFTGSASRWVPWSIFWHRLYIHCLPPMVCHHLYPTIANSLMKCWELCKKDVFAIFSWVGDVSTIPWVYFQGTRRTFQPIWSRIYARPLLLAFHFYAVALYSIFLLFRKSSIPSYPRMAVKGVVVLWTACIVFIPVVISELLP